MAAVCEAPPGIATPGNTSPKASPPFAPSQAAISAALRHASQSGVLPLAREAGLLGKPVALFYDLDAWEENLRDCARAFGAGCLHSIAFKSNPVCPMMGRAKALGFGAECASIGEVLSAQALGFAPEKILFDSPCKTHAEISWALQSGIRMNMDNFEEVDRVARLWQTCEVPPVSVIGLRLNPLVGAGQIAELSVSTADSKFGISAAWEEQIVAAFTEHEWLTCLHIHTGSGGMSLETLVAGVRVAVDMATRINQQLGRKQVRVLDIGGGLPVNYGSDAEGSAPSFDDYVEGLRRAVPGLFPSDGCSGLFEEVVTEFGQSLNAKSGFLASRVEYVKPNATKTSQIVTVHMGAHINLRQCYTSEHPRRLEAFDGQSCLPKEGPSCPHVIAGPLCFQGDILAKGLELPRLEMEDFVVMRDTGANCLSLFSHHCSRQSPMVLGFRRGDDGEIADMQVLKGAEGFDPTFAFWGGGEVPEALKQGLERHAREWPTLQQKAAALRPLVRF